MTKVGIIVAEPLELDKIYTWINQLGFELTIISRENETDTTPQLAGTDFALILLSSGAAYSDSFRDQCRDLRRLNKHFYILANRNDIENYSFEIPYHLRGLPYFDVTHASIWKILESYLRNPRISYVDNNGIFALPDLKQSLLANNDTQYHPLTNVQNLRRAWLKVWNHAKTDTTYYDELSYSLYHDHLDANLVVLSALLQRGEFALQPLFCLSVPKTSSDRAAEKGQKPDTRELYYAQPETAIILQAICDSIAPKIEGILDLHIEDQSSKQVRVTYANRIITDQQDTVDIFYHWRESHSRFRSAIKNFAYTYPESKYFRTDIQKYYPSIDTTYLKSLLEALIDDNFILRLLDQFLNLTAVDINGEQTTIRGIPAGIPIAHLLGNVYLHEIDKLMAAKSLGYFRYVDDVIFFAETEKDRLDLRSYFYDLLRNLGQAGLSFYLPTDNPNKSFEGSSNEVAKLDAAIEHLSPLLRINFSEFPEGEQRQKLGEFIYEALITIENIEDENADEIYAKYAALAVYKLKELDYRHDLSPIVYKFLKRAPLRSRTIRSLIDYLVERVIANPEELLQFEHFLRDPQVTDYLTLAFLQSLRSYKKLPKHVWQYLRKLIEIDNLLIVGETLYTFWQHKRSIKGYQARLIERFFVARNSFFSVRAFLYLLRAKIPHNTLVEIAYKLLNSDDPQQQSIVFGSSKDLLKLRINQKILDACANRRLSLLAVASFAYWVRTNVTSSENVSFRASFLDGLTLQIVDLDTQGRADILASSLGNVLTLEEVNLIQSPIFSAQQAKLLLEKQEVFSNDIFYFDKYKKIADNERLENPHRHDYLSLRIEWGNDRKGFLEIIRYKLLQSKGFKDIQDWIDYLKQLEIKYVVTIVDVVDLRNGNIAVIYEIPRGFNPLAAIFAEETATKSSFSASQAFLLLSKINNQATKTWDRTKETTYRFVTIHSDFVLVDHHSDIEFVCLGASLDNTPRYLVAKAHLNEGQLGIEDATAGFEAYSLFLAYLLFEMLIGQNPVFLSKTLEKNQYLSDLNQLDAYQAHIKGFIARAANTIPKFRYKDYEAISLDLEHIGNFFHYLDRHGESLSNDQLLLVEFVDYMRLRLGTHKRNPEIAVHHPDKRPLDLSLPLSRDLTRFAPRDTAKRKWLMEKFGLSNSEKHFDRVILDWCSAPSRKLLKIYAFWQQIVESYLSLPDTHSDFDLQVVLEILATHVIWIERTAYVQTLGRWAGNNYLKDEVKPKGLESAKFLLQQLPLVDLNMTDFSFPYEECEAVKYCIDEVFLDLSKNKFQAPKKLGLTSPALLFSLCASRTLAIFDDQQQVIWHSKTDKLTDEEQAKSKWRLSTAFLMRDYYRRLVEFFPLPAPGADFPTDEDGKPRTFFTHSSELPSTFDLKAGERLLIYILQGLRECHPGYRTIGNVITYSAKPKSFDTAEGQIKLATYAPYSFYDYDLIEKPDQLSLPSDGAIATIDMYHKVGRADANIGAIVVTPANLFEIFPDDLDQLQQEMDKMRDQIFISYSHKDEELLNELLEHLRPLVRHGVISEPWSDKKIKTGEEWKKAIDNALSCAKLVILLVSPSFLASEFIAEEELKPIYEATRYEGLTIFVVHIRRSSYKVDKYLSSLQSANKPEEPIARLKTVAERDDEWVAVAEKLIEAFNK